MTLSNPAIATIAVAASDQTWADAAGRLARELGLSLLPPGTAPADYTAVDFILRTGGEGLAIYQTGRRAPGPVSVDFGSGSMRHRRRAAHNELLGRAVGWRPGFVLRVLDATAGLGRDGFVLADLGCEVTLCERSPLVAALLSRGLEQARGSDDPWLGEVSARLRLWHGDSRALPATRLAQVDVVYLDPMFPLRDKSAGVKKEMVLLQQLLPPQEEAAPLLAWALGLDVARVVVKRPSRAPALEGRPPSHVIRGKAVRYDVYVKRKLPVTPAAATVIKE